jgi:hypothetical protein
MFGQMLGAIEFTYVRRKRVNRFDITTTRQGQNIFQQNFFEFSGKNDKNNFSAKLDIPFL